MGVLLSSTSRRNSDLGGFTTLDLIKVVLTRPLPPVVVTEQSLERTRQTENHVGLY